jgi:hypothetical protein
MASTYVSKTIKIIAEFHRSVATAWHTYYIVKNGRKLCAKRRGCSAELPLMFDSQKKAKQYIYRHGILKSKRTFIPVEFTGDIKN